MDKSFPLCNEICYSSKFPWSNNFIIFVDHENILYKISLHNAWLVNEEVSVFGSNNSRNL